MDSQVKTMGKPTYSVAPAVKVTGNDAWTGNIADNSGSRSVDGSGSQTFQLTDDPGVVAVTFQKDNSNEVSQSGTKNSKYRNINR